MNTMSNDTVLNYLIMNYIDYEGYEIIHTRDDKYLIVDWYEYFDTLSGAKNAIDDFIRKNNKTNNDVKENIDMKENKRLFIKNAQNFNGNDVDESLKEDVEKPLTTDEFLAWHDGYGGAHAPWEVLDKIYKIFLDNGSDESEDVDLSYAKLPVEMQLEITKIIKSISENTDKAVVDVDESLKEDNNMCVLTFRPDVEPDEEMLAGCKDEDRKWGFESEYDAEHNTWHIKGAKETLDKYIKELDLKDNEYELKKADKQESLNEGSEDNAQKLWSVPVVYEMYGRVDVEAASAADAYRIVANHPERFSLPTDANYVDDSFRVADDDEENGIGLVEPVEEAQKSLSEECKDKKIIFFGKEHENRELDEASKKLPYGALAWQLNEIISAMNDEGAYYESGWLYIWPDGATRQDAIDSFSTKEDYEELEDLFKRVYKKYHRSGLYKVSDKVLERAHQWDKKLGLSQIVDVNDKDKKQSVFDDELEMKIGEVLKNAGIDEDSYEIAEEYNYKNIYFYDNTTAKKALQALKDSNEFLEVKGYVEEFPLDGHSSIEVLVTIPEE